MKEATGELNMTVVTIIAIGAVIAFFWVMWKPIKEAINKQWNKTQDNDVDSQDTHNIDNIIIPNIW